MTKCWICRNEFVRQPNDTSKDDYVCEQCWIDYEDDYELLKWEEDNSYDDRIVQ